MLLTINIYRLKLSSLIRQFYLPGMRGAVFIFFINVFVLILLQMAARQAARAAVQQTRQIAKPARRLAYAPVNINR